MPSTPLAISQIPAEVQAGLQQLQKKLELPDSFSAEVLQDAQEATVAELSGYQDFTQLEFVTIDPASSLDLDQAVCIARDGAGYLVYYAISDVAHFVRSGTALEAETHNRGQSMYAPSAKIPLHPKSLSEDAASLLADNKPRPAMVWQLKLDEQGELLETHLTRALVRNRAKLSYEQVEADLAAGQLHPSIALLPQVGQLRQALEVTRGGISLNLPTQEIVERDGTWTIEYRRMSPIENYNAQISLLTGFAAAQVMLQGKIGILRTLPPAEDWSLAKLRRSAKALGVDWPAELSYPEFVRALDPTDPKQLAVLTKCTMLFRGADYLSFDGQVPSVNLEHAALAAAYAHTTAPLRRLVDRYVLETCHALLNGLDVPQWVKTALPTLPEEMSKSSRTANAYERGVLDLAEALILQHRIGEVFDGVLTDVHPKTGIGTVQVADPAVELRLPADAALVGTRVQIKLLTVDIVNATLEACLV